MRYPVLALAVALGGCANASSGDQLDGGGGAGVDAGDQPCQADNGELCLPEDGVFVDGAAGSDSAAGTMAEPLATIGAGIVIAGNYSPPRAVFVANGTYDESIELASGVSIFGGFRASAGWERDASLYVTEIRGGVIAVRGQGLVQPTYLDGLTITSAAAIEPGDSSIAVLLADCDDVILSNVIVESGNGAAGVSGTPGMPGVAGSPGSTGQPGCEDSGGFCSGCGRPNGGAGGGSSCGRTGGPGGRPGNGGGSGEAGQPGTGGTPGGAGGGGGGGGDGTAGDPGAPGATGTHGLGGVNFGSFVAEGYLPANGEDGQLGGDGNGGGGGGGGGGGNDDCDSYGSSGGGGGGGGCGGTGGTAGGGGGGSFGVVAIDSRVRVMNSQIGAGSGGAGGAGAAGGGGGAGGGAGAGGAYGGGGEQDDGGMGGPGGVGGPGGAGGAGGGGGGGPSAALVCIGESNLTIPGTQLAAAGGGAGGASDGNPGEDGLATMAYACGLF